MDDLTALAATGYRARVIYADPPWPFKVYSGRGKQRSADRYYDTQPLASIMALGPAVEALAAKDCALFLWAVSPELRGAQEVIEAWGFNFKTVGFVWVKTTQAGEPATGMGYWTRSNVEQCLLATRGSPSRIDMGVSQVVMAPRGQHSAKPEEVASRIEQLMNGPYLELFARHPRPGWHVWGDETPMSKSIL
ncbi:MT-A70 family methyltransferase [Phyllobacterium sp. CL33Tsu]|uniref:MT-A70 family methyltransferase n=1 Tax=Phyllobacterium sp. CL33Tsu TaxID=1798191 RepID=UPI003297EA63